VFDARRVTGPGAGVVKYDILTALGLIGLHGQGTVQMSMLRLIAALTARYNWRADEMSVGQRDLARLWAVTERTAKREVKRLTATRLILVRRPGVRGRVASYRLNMPEIARQSRPHWDAVGPDYAERMAAMSPAEATVVHLGFPARPAEERPAEGQGGTWRAVRARLRADDPAAFANWYEHLSFLGRDGGEMRLRATTPFVGRYVETHLARPLSRAIEAELGPFDRLRIECDG
jgi:hypothetical protein